MFASTIGQSMWPRPSIWALRIRQEDACVIGKKQWIIMMMIIGTRRQPSPLKMTLHFALVAVANPYCCPVWCTLWMTKKSATTWWWHSTRCLFAQSFLREDVFWAAGPAPCRWSESSRMRCEKDDANGTPVSWALHSAVNSVLVDGLAGKRGSCMVDFLFLSRKALFFFNICCHHVSHLTCLRYASFGRYGRSWLPYGWCA